MNTINLFSIIEAYNKLDKKLFQDLLQYYGIISGNHKGVKDEELDGIEALIKNIQKEGRDISIYDNFYLGYIIPQIGKEFDLIRLGDSYIINIEIKSTSTTEKILKQQKRNEYYLRFLNKETHIYTFIQDKNKLYKLNFTGSNYETKEVTFKDLYNNLLAQSLYYINNIDDLFDPTNYLVSPFNCTDKFINGEYFLTEQQEEIYTNIQKQLSDETTKFMALTGGAGTGKTLLTYHIAKELIEAGKKVIILHCAMLNEGHYNLNDKFNWEIYMPKYAPNIDDYDFIIIDEAQRMLPKQFEKIKNIILSSKKKCIFSYDEKQYLKDDEYNNDIKGKIETILSNKTYKLTDKIRTNKKISYFITQIFHKGTNVSNIIYPNIELMYCSNYDTTKAVLNDLSEKGWKVPNYTPGIRSTFRYEIYKSDDKDTAHSVIGQEFDNVAIVIDKYFHYNEKGELTSSTEYYSQKQMLYQIITRARKKLYVIIVDNKDVLERCIGILNQ